MQTLKPISNPSLLSSVVSQIALEHRKLDAAVVAERQRREAIERIAEDIKVRASRIHKIA